MYDNPINRQVVGACRRIMENHINHINQQEEHICDPTSQLEGMAMRNENICGGSGYAAATVQDLGFEPTDGLTGAGVSGGKKPRKQRKKRAAKIESGGALLSLASMDSMHGQPPDATTAKITIKASPHKDQQLDGAGFAGAGASGGGSSGGAKTKRANARNAIVQQVMKEKGLKLIEASRYVKENGLYKK